MCNLSGILIENKSYLWHSRRWKTIYKGGKRGKIGKFFLSIITVIFMLVLILLADTDIAIADSTYNVDFVFDVSGLRQAVPQPAIPSNNIETKPNQTSSSGRNTSSNKQPASIMGDINTGSANEQLASTQNEAVTSREIAEIRNNKKLWKRKR